MIHYLNHHNCVSIQTYLFAVHSVSVALINRLSEEAIAVIVDPEAAANVQMAYARQHIGSDLNGVECTR